MGEFTKVQMGLLKALHTTKRNGHKQYKGCCVGSLLQGDFPPLQQQVGNTAVQPSYTLMLRKCSHFFKNMSNYKRCDVLYLVLLMLIYYSSLFLESKWQLLYFSQTVSLVVVGKVTQKHYKIYMRLFTAFENKSSILFVKLQFSISLFLQ